MTISLARLLATGALALSLSVPSAGHLAFGDGGGGGGGGGAGGGGSDNEVKCREGMTYNKEKGICEWASLLPDELLNEQGRALALTGHFENALDALIAVRRPDAVTFTYIGYAKRKMGAVEEGISWYRKALAIEPDNLHTHEYLGEGYVAAGRSDLAELELATLQSLCGTECDQYRALAAAIAGEPENWGGR